MLLDVTFKKHFGAATMNLALSETLHIFGQLQTDGKSLF